MNPTAAAPISQEPMRRSLFTAPGIVRSVVMVAISFISFFSRLSPSTVQDDGRTDPIAVWGRCNKVAGSVVLNYRRHACGIRHRHERGRRPRSHQGGLPGARPRRAAGPLLAREAAGT